MGPMQSSLIKEFIYYITESSLDDSIRYRNVVLNGLHCCAGMRILPDARDLINLTEHGRPVGTEEFCNYLEAHQHQIALSFTNIRELAGPLARRGDFLQVRRWLQALETPVQQQIINNLQPTRQKERRAQQR